MLWHGLKEQICDIRLYTVEGFELASPRSQSFQCIQSGSTRHKKQWGGLDGADRSKYVRAEYDIPELLAIAAATRSSIRICPSCIAILRHIFRAYLQAD